MLVSRLSSILNPEINYFGRKVLTSQIVHKCQFLTDISHFFCVNKIVIDHSITTRNILIFVNSAIKPHKYQCKQENTTSFFDTKNVVILKKCSFN